MAIESFLLKIFFKLLEHYGPRKWWPGKTKFEVIVGAILVQSVAWENARFAVNNLKKEGLLSPQAILSATHEEIATKIISSRFYNQKTEKLKHFCSHLMAHYDGSLSKMFSNTLSDLREDLLHIKGIGRETADSILLYAGNQLSFVSDAYTKRWIERYGLFDGLSTYDQIREFFMNNLPEDLYIYNEYHALIVRHSKSICKSVPQCHLCPIKRITEIICCRLSENS